ncbi:MAG TPA: DUF5606 domain-containing protein [Bacteroidales bacterium]|nr:DUF5606 domain-containing protein [Bacteroidales bacterium]
MVLKDILSISGEPGLFRFLAQGKNAIIIEHLETKKRGTAYGTAKVSSLEDIAIFTEKEDVSLSKVFDLIFEKENGGPAIDPKSDNAKLTKWFENVLPDYSRNKVYVSDIKKVAQWYNILHKLDLLVKEEPEKAEEDKPVEQVVASEENEKQEKKAPAKKKKKQSPEA